MRGQAALRQHNVGQSIMGKSAECRRRGDAPGRSSNRGNGPMSEIQGSDSGSADAGPWVALLGGEYERWVAAPATGASDGWVPLTDLGILEFRGAQCGDFLQGYVTRETLNANPEEARFAATCDIRGRTTSNGWLMFGDGIIRYRTHATLLSPLADNLKRYAVFSRTELANSSLVGVGLLGVPPAFLDLPTDAPTGRLVALEGGHALRTFAGWELWLEPTTVASMLPNLPAPLPHAAWQSAAIAAGVVTVVPETSELWLPQAWGANRLQAVDFDKGCYLGQEVVARLQHRGESKRTLCRLASDSVDPAAAPGDALVDHDGRNIGHLAAVAHQQGTGASALAVLGRDALPATWKLIERYEA